MRLRAATLTLIFSLMLASPAMAAAVSSPDASLSGPISDEQTTTYWAYSVQSAPVRAAPHAGARILTHLNLWTEDGFPEDYVILAQQVYPSETWFQVRIPGRPNGRTGWVPEESLGDLSVTHKHVVIDEQHLRVTVYSWGRRIFSAPVGVGKASTPTPTGRFWIRERFRSTDPFYGPYAFGTADYSTLSERPHGGVVGIHGTDQPSLVPGRPSHGCIRMKNGDVTRLWQLVGVGTPLTVI
jgi:lipoprotein-anchoring transpeptidase ErfK/SrfK